MPAATAEFVPREAKADQEFVPPEAKTEFVPPEAKTDQEFVPPEAKPTLPVKAVSPLPRSASIMEGVPLKGGVTPPPQAAGGVPTEEELAYRTPQPAVIAPEVSTGQVYKPSISLEAPPPAPPPSTALPRSASIMEGVPLKAGVAPPPQAAGGVPTEEELAYRTPQAAVVGPEATRQQVEKPAEPIPAAVTAVTHPDDPNAQGSQVQVGDQTGKYLYNEADRVQSLINWKGNKQDLLVEATKYKAEHPEQTPADIEIEERLLDAIQKAPANTPGGLETAWRLTTGAADMFLNLPHTAGDLLKAGITSAQAGAVVAKMYAGKVTGQDLLTPQDEVTLKTVMSILEQGRVGGFELGEDIRDFLVRHRNRMLLGNTLPSDPNQLTWDDINKLPPDQQRAAIRARIDSRAARSASAAARARGELDPYWVEEFQRLTGHDPNTAAAEAAHGIYVDPNVVTTGGMFSPTNLANLLLPVGEGFLGRALAAEGGAARAALTESAADLLSATGVVSKKGIEWWAPTVGKVGVRTAVAWPVRATLGHLPFPFNMLAASSLAKTKQFAGALGEKLGQSFQWMRENALEPYANLLREQAEGIRTGTNPVQANRGPLGPLLTAVPAGAIKGAAIAAPFAAGAQTPEEVGGTLAFGALAGGVYAGLKPARDAAFSTIFFRDPDKYPTYGSPKFDYGTKYGGGMVLDPAHNNWYNAQDVLTQQRINDLRKAFPNVEQYWLNNADYQRAVQHLQTYVNPATGDPYLPGGNQRTRGLNVVTDPTTGKALVLVNGDSGSRMFDIGAHEIGHSVYQSMTPQEKLMWQNLGAQSNNMDGLTQWYTRHLSGTGHNYTDLPTEAQIKSGTKQYLPGLNGLTQEHMNEELGAETVAALLRGQPVHTFTTDPTLIRRAQIGLGRIANKLGFNVTPEEAQTILGFKPSMAHVWLMDKVLRDYFKRNPSNIPAPAPGPPGGGGGRQGPIPRPKGRQTAAVPTPTGGPAPVPPPPPSVGPKVTGGLKVTNNQPEIGGGATGAPQSEIDDAVIGLQGLKFPKRQAQQMVANASGQNTAELVRSALRNHEMAKGRIEVPRAPQEAAEAQAPPLPHPLAAHRELESPALLRRAITGDPEATQALIERHGANWLQAVEKEDPKVAAEFRRKYAEQAAEQDQRIKAGVEAKPEPIPKAADLPTTTSPHDAIAARAYELFQERGGAHGHEQEDWAQAERELRQRGIDAAKDRIAGRAAFMPMAGERAQMFPEEEGGGRVFMSPVHGAKQFEIDDRDMTWVPGPRGAGQTMIDHNWETRGDGTSRLGEIINHPTLFQNYPDLRNIRVEMRPEMRGNGGYLAPVPGEREKILLKTIDRGTLAHEIQHAVQFRENWPPGSNPERVAREMEDDDAIRKDLSAYFDAYYPELGPTEFRSQHDYINYLADRSDQWSQWYRDRISRMASGAYLMSPGEVEARAVGKRAVQPPGWRMPPEEMLTQEQALTKARVQEDFRRMAEPPIGKQKVSFMPEIPEKPGTESIPEGHVRLFHQTGQENLDSIKRNGLQIGKAKGIEGPKAIYASETGFYGDPSRHPTIEFHVPKNQWQDPYVRGDSVPPENIIAAHEPWHASARYVEAHPEAIRSIVAGERDALAQSHPTQARVLDYIKSKYGERPPVGFMPEIPEEVRLRGAGAEKGKEAVRLRYDGAPPGVTDARGLRKLKDRLKQMALEGEAFRHWYTEGAEPMMRGVGNDPHRFEKLMANIAATSPQNKVYPNFGMAVRGLAQQESGGRRITIGKGSMKQRLSEIGQGNIWEGVKINQFYRDHMAVFDKRLADDMGSTMDMHMARAFGYPTDVFTPKQSQWSQGIMRELNEELGWGKPKEVQAAIWSSIKGRFETVWPDIYADAKANGDIITKVTKSGFEKSAFKDPATELKYRNRALKEAMQIPPPDLSEAAFNFGDALKRDLGAISYETRPSSTIQEQHPWMKQMMPQDWDEYHRQQAGVLLDPDGTNKLAKLTNLISIGEHQGYSAWGTERNLSEQMAAVMPKAAEITRKRAGQKWKIDPSVEHQVKDFAAAVALLYRQDGVGWHRPYFEEDATWKDTNAFHVNQGRSLSAEETKAIVDNLEKLVPSYESDEKGWFVAPDERGLRIVSRGQADNKQFYKLVEQTINSTLPESSTGKIDRFPTYGNLISNNWEENPNGEVYRRWLSARRRPDIQRLVDDSLRPQVQAIDDSWRIRKSGETEGGRRAAIPEEIGQKVGAMPEGPPAERPRAPPSLYPPVSPTGFAQEQERKRQEKLPAAVTELEPPPEPEVRRGMIMLPKGQERPAVPSAPPSVAQEPPSQPPSAAEPGIDIQARSYTRGRTVKPQWIVLHSTDATEGSSINTLTQGGKSVHYLTTRDGRLLHFVPEADTAFHAGKDKFGKDGNPASIGFEQVHNDDLNEPWDDAEVRATARGVAGAMQRWGIPLNHVIGHGDLAPGRKVDPKNYPWDKFYQYVREYSGGGGVPSQQTTASQPATAGRKTNVNAAAGHIMRQEGSSGVQDGIPEIFGFRQGQDSEYDALASARASGNEDEVRRIATKGFVDRAIAAGGQQFSDPAVKAQILSLAHMRGPGGARDILQAVATGRIDNSGSVPQLDADVVKAINAMSRAEVLRRIQIARTVYDKAVHGEDYWNRFGRGLADRYAREREFYGSLN